MSSLISVMCLTASLMGARLDLKLDGDLQVYGGYTHTPYIAVGPDTQLLPNAPVQPASTMFNLIVSPGADLTLKLQDVSLHLNYAPRVFLDLKNFFGGQPQVFHRVQLGAVIGRPTDWLLTLGGNLTVGGLDFGGAGAPTGAGVVQSAAQNGQSALSNYVNMGATARLEHNFDRSFGFVSTLSASKIITPTDSPVAAPGAQASGVPNDPNALANAPLQLHGIDRAEWKNELLYKLDAQNTLGFELGGSAVSFPQDVTYLGFTPQIGYEATFSRATKFHIKGGFLHYWAEPFRSVTRPAQNQWVGEVGAEHTFSDIGLPRLKGLLSLGEAPWYDLVYGVLEPRATLTANLTYQFSQRFEGSLQLRDYTEAYFDAHGWRPIPVNHDKNVAILSSQIKYKYSAWLSYTAGIFYLDRSIVPSGTSATTELKEVYFFVGLTGTYDLE